MPKHTWWLIWAIIWEADIDRASFAHPLNLVLHVSVILHLQWGNLIPCFCDLHSVHKAYVHHHPKWNKAKFINLFIHKYFLHPICSRHFISTGITNMNGPTSLKDSLLSRRDGVQDMSRIQMREVVNSVRIRNQERLHGLRGLFSGSRFRIKYSLLTSSLHRIDHSFHDLRIILAVNDNQSQFDNFSSLNYPHR